jgi:hypothetical protein
MNEQLKQAGNIVAKEYSVDPVDLLLDASTPAEVVDRSTSAGVKYTPVAEFKRGRSGEMPYIKVNAQALVSDAQNKGYAVNKETVLDLLRHEYAHFMDLVDEGTSGLSRANGAHGDNFMKENTSKLFSGSRVLKIKK